MRDVAGNNRRFSNGGTYLDFRMSLLMNGFTCKTGLMWKLRYARMTEASVAWRHNDSSRGYLLSITAKIMQISSVDF